MSLRRKDGETYPLPVENEVVSVESLCGSGKSATGANNASKHAQDLYTSPQNLPQAVVIIVPLTPPTVNTYVRHTRTGGHYIVPEARAFKEAVAIYGRGNELVADAYAITIDVYLGFGQRLDIDNAGKLSLDGLTYGRVIDSDAKVTDLHLRKHRDANNPRTEICIEVLETKKRRQKPSQPRG